MSDLVTIKVHIMKLVPAVNIDLGDDSTVEWSAARLSTVWLCPYLLGMHYSIEVVRVFHH